MNKIEAKTEVGKRIAYIRHERGLTQEQLGCFGTIIVFWILSAGMCVAAQWLVMVLEG